MLSARTFPQPPPSGSAAGPNLSRGNCILPLCLALTLPDVISTYLREACASRRSEQRRMILSRKRCIAPVTFTFSIEGNLGARLLRPDSHRYTRSGPCRSGNRKQLLRSWNGLFESCFVPPTLRTGRSTRGFAGGRGGSAGHRRPSACQKHLPGSIQPRGLRIQPAPQPPASSRGLQREGTPGRLSFHAAEAAKRDLATERDFGVNPAAGQRGRFFSAAAFLSPFRVAAWMG